MSDGWEEEALVLFVVSPLLGVLASVIGSAILNAAGHSGYTPLYIAARIGAFGAPIAAVACVFVSATLVDDTSLDDAEVERLRQQAGLWSKIRLYGDIALIHVRTAWGFAAPYAISVAGPPIGSALFASIGISREISPLHAVRAGALGGIFAVPIYFGIILGISKATSEVAARLFDDTPSVPGSGGPGDPEGLPYAMRERPSEAVEAELLEENRFTEEERLAHDLSEREHDIQDRELIRQEAEYDREEAFLRENEAAYSRDGVEAAEEANFERNDAMAEDEMRHRMREAEYRSHLGSGSRADDLTPRVEMRQFRRPYGQPPPQQPAPPPAPYRPPPPGQYRPPPTSNLSRQQAPAAAYRRPSPAGSYRQPPPAASYRQPSPAAPYRQPPPATSYRQPPPADRHGRR